MADWKSLLDNLSSYLSRDCFPAEIRQQRTPSTYDSPSNFDPATWKQQIEPVIETLRLLETSNN
jgi:hypothetical protein